MDTRIPPLNVATEWENVAIVRYKRAMLGTTSHLTYDYFKAEALWKVKGSAALVRVVNAVSKLSTIIISPWKELSVATLNLL